MPLQLPRGTLAAHPIGADRIGMARGFFARRSVLGLVTVRWLVAG